MISKDTLAEVLGIDEDSLTDSVFAWAVASFYRMTGLKATATSKTHREFVSSAKTWIKLPDTNIASITTLKLDNVTTSFVLFTDLKFNPDTGLVNYSGGFSGGQLVEITYSVAAFTHEDIHDYLVALLTTKALSIFTPSVLGQVKMVKIGKYQRQYANVSDDLDSFLKTLDTEIHQTVNIILGDNGKMQFGTAA